VISLKKFLDSNIEPDLAAARVVQRLMEGIHLHSVEAEPEDYVSFRASIQQIAQAMSRAATAEELMVQTGAALKTLETYARKAARYFGRRNAEFQTMFRMLTGTIKTISDTSDENLRQLREIESHVLSAVEIEDVCLMKSQLSDVLDQIRLETQRQKTEALQRVDELKRCLRQAPDLDLVTGLPGRPQAESTLERVCESEKPWYAAVLVVESLTAINLRFGEGVGNEVLQSFAEFVSERLSPEDHLFRWSKQTLLGLLLRFEGAAPVREFFARTIDRNQFEHTVITPSRNVLLPITVRWAVFPVAPPSRDLVKKMDAFVRTPVTSK